MHRPSGYDAQVGNQAELLAKIAAGIRSGKYSTGIEASKIVLVGHSLGSLISAGAIIGYPTIAEGNTARALSSATNS
jgi:hypothetical protein